MNIKSCKNGYDEVSEIRLYTYIKHSAPQKTVAKVQYERIVNIH